MGAKEGAKKKKFNVHYKTVYGKTIDENCSIRKMYYRHTGNPLGRLCLSKTQEIDLSHEIKLAKNDVVYKQKAINEIHIMIKSLGKKIAELGQRIKSSKVDLQDSIDWLCDLQRVKANIKTNATTEMQLLKELFKVEELRGHSNGKTC